MAGIDYVGVSTLITALGTIVIGAIVALRQSGVRSNVQDIHDQTQVSGAATIGEVIDHVHDVVCGEKPAATTPAARVRPDTGITSP